MNWKFKEDAEPQGSSNGFWYDINNGYIDLEKILVSPEQLKAANEAIDLIVNLEEAMDNAELTEEF